MAIDTQRLLKLLSRRGVSGCEGDVRAAIMDIVKPLCDEVYVDTIGNLFAHRRGAGKRVMACAHMDEVGMMISHFRDDGLLEYATVGGIDPRVLVSKRVVIGENRVPGVIGSKAIHLQSEAEYHSVLGHDKLRIDIGATSADEAKKLVKLGDYVTFDSEPELFGDGCVCSRALDDRVGCLALISALEGSYDCDFTAVFTVQEEVGLRGARVAALRVQPELALVLEGTTSNDLGEVDEHLRVCEVGKGVAISFMDRGSIANVQLYRQLLELAEREGIPHQVKNVIAGGNDAGAIQTRAGAVATCVLSVPCRNIHSPASVAALSDMEAQAQLLCAFLRTL